MKRKRKKKEKKKEKNEEERRKKKDERFIEGTEEASGVFISYTCVEKTKRLDFQKWR